MGPYPETVVGKCTRKKFFGLGRVCGGDIVVITKARFTANGELLYGPGIIAGYQCVKCKKKYDQPPFDPMFVEALGV